MKKIMATILSVIAIISIFSTTVYAQTFTPYTTSKSKNDFATLYKENGQNKRSLTKEEKDKISNIMKAYLANDIVNVKKILGVTSKDEITFEQISEFLSSYGYYVYSYTHNQQSKITSNNPNDVYFGDTLIVYAPYYDRWYVTVGGYWKNEFYLDEKFDKKIVELKDMDESEMEQIGYEVEDNSDVLLTQVNATGYIHDKNGNYIELFNQKNISNPIFSFADYLYETDSKVSYMGYGFSSQVIYNKNFKDYNDKITPVYKHNDSNLNAIDNDSNFFVALWNSITNFFISIFRR